MFSLCLSLPVSCTVLYMYYICVAMDCTTCRCTCVLHMRIGFELFSLLCGYDKHFNSYAFRIDWFVYVNSKSETKSGYVCANKN